MTKSLSFGSFIGGFMLGALFVGAWFFNDNPALLPFSSLRSPVAKTTDSTTTQPESGAVSVIDQPAGTAVTIESVTVPPPGVWIAVREVNGTDLGNVLGATRVVGPRSSVSVALLRATVSGTSYAVELYRDDGNDTFDLTSDSVYIDFNTGAPVIAYFKTTN